MGSAIDSASADRQDTELSPTTVDEPNATIKRAFDMASDYPSWNELDKIAQTRAFRLGIEDGQISVLVERRDALEDSSSADAEAIRAVREDIRRYILESFADCHLQTPDP